MSGTYRHGRTYCQMADCRNRATRLAKVELPASWSEADEYSVRTVLVGVCGECGRDLEARGRALISARAEFGGLLRKAAKLRNHLDTLRLLVELLKAIGPPFEPEQGSTYARWLARLDRPRAQMAWRLLALIKRQETPKRKAARGRTPAVAAPDPSPGDPAA
jgi:hypothetical protein